MMQSNKNKLLILTTFLLYFMGLIYAKEANAQDATLNKNAIYANVGAGGLYFTAAGYFERILVQQSKISHFIKVGTGGYALWGEGGQYILAQYGILTGRKKHHLELGAGPNWFLNGDLKNDYPFTATIGWRIQKPASNFLFRMGASFPEAVYVGLGVPF